MTANGEYLLEARGLKKRFGDNVVLDGVSLQVPAGSVVSVLGKSGTGKSVFLKCLAGVMHPDEGEILYEGKVLRASEPGARREFRQRCSYLFQHNALLDSLTALDNVALPLEQTPGSKRKDFLARAREMLRLLELDEYRARYPSELSGGMRKRLALARALVTKPQLVLFDEPTAGLDPVRRNAVFAMIARYQRELGFTAVVVTHDLAEVLVASERVAFLEEGQIRFEGTPEEVAECTDTTVRAFRDSVDDLRAELAASGNKGAS